MAPGCWSPWWAGWACSPPSCGTSSDRPFPGFDVPEPGPPLGPGNQRPDRAGSARPRPSRHVNFIPNGPVRTPASTSPARTGTTPRCPTRRRAHLAAGGDRTGWRYATCPRHSGAKRSATSTPTRRPGTGTSFAEAAAENRHRLIQAVQDLSGEDWHGLPAKHVWSPVEARLHGPVRAPGRLGRDGLPRPGLPARLQTSPWTSSSRTRCATPTRPSTRCSGTDAQPLPRGPGAQRIGLAAARRRPPDRPLRQGTSGGSPTTTNSTWSSWAAARAARSCCSGWPGRAGGWRRSTPSRCGTPTPTG